MIIQTRRGWGVGLVAGLVACGLFGSTPVQAQSVPIIIPPIAPIVVGNPPVFVGVSEHSQGGISWSVTGRADVDINIDHHHGHAAAR